MTVRSVSLLVLDAQGVVFNAPFLWFLEQAAAELARDPEGMLALWRDELRIPTWTGAISEAEFWRRLTGSNGRADQYRKQLATMYELGPAAGRLAHWNSVAPIWLLSNHRSDSRESWCQTSWAAPSRISRCSLRCWIMPPTRAQSCSWTIRSRTCRQPSGWECKRSWPKAKAGSPRSTRL